MTNVSRSIGLSDLVFMGDGYRPTEKAGFYVDTINTMIPPPSTGLIADSIGHVALAEIPLPTTLSDNII